VVDELEIDLKSCAAAGDRRPRESATGGEEVNLPPVIDQRRVGKPDAAALLPLRVARLQGQEARACQAGLAGPIK